MRSMILSLILGLGAIGLSLGAPTQVKADDYRGPAFTSSTVPVAYHWRGRSHYRGFYPGYGGYYGRYRGFYPGYGGYGLYRGYGYYPYGGYGGFYGRRFYGGYYPWGYGYGYGPYSSFYYSPGYFW
jgi:hypothetical protein